MLNPILFTERVVQDFLRYQLTAYPFADKALYAQMRKLLNLDETRRSPLMKGPYVSLSRTFEEGIAVADAVKEGWLHTHLTQLISHPHLYGHQEQAIRAITSGRTTLVSTGTGSGKTECFLYPIISRCLQLRDKNAPPGISAVIVYPMNALADDQMDRLRELLAGTGIRFGIYTGNLKENTKDATGHRLPPGSSAEDYRKRLAKERSKVEGKDRQIIHPAEENISREEMRNPSLRPRLLLTNVKQLELLLTRQKDIEMFDGATLDYLVFDEAHTFRGTMGAETACLIRRLRSYCGKSPTETVCVTTSATIVDPKNEGSSAAGREFASRFFGVEPDKVELVGERYQPDVWAPEGLRTVPPALNGNPADHLTEILRAVEQDDDEAGKAIALILKLALGMKLSEKNWRLNLYEELSRNELLFQLVELLRGARGLEELSAEVAKKIGRAVTDEEVLLWLALGAASRKEERPLVRPVIHTFVRGMGGAVVTFPPNQTEPKLYLSAETVEEIPELGAKLKPLPVLSCTTCGQHYFEHWAKDFAYSGDHPSGGQAIDKDHQYWEACDDANGGKRAVLLDRLIAQEDGDEEQPDKTATVWFCRVCGCLHSHPQTNCKSCGRPEVLTRIYAAQTRQEGDGRLGSCLCCGARGRMAFGRHREPARPVRAVTVSDVHVLAQNMLQHAERKRLLVFADIGQLDSVLMRNVPPQPANYFQRAGRAGRRHRMAVNLTYARPASHDRAFFESPEKLLNGVVLPPRFNLSNPVLVRHHAHAVLLTTLFSMAQKGGHGISSGQQEEVQEVLKATLPPQIGPFFFEASGYLTTTPAKVTAFEALVLKHRETLLEALRAAFTQGWPTDDAPVVTDGMLTDIINTAAAELQEIINRIWTRLQWHLRQLDRLRDEEAKQGALSDEETAFRERCRRYVNKIKGNGGRPRGIAEGFDDTNIYAVLAAESWLPGYGLDTGSVIGSAIKSIASMSRDDFDLRPQSLTTVRRWWC